MAQFRRRSIIQWRTAANEILDLRQKDCEGCVMGLLYLEKIHKNGTFPSRPFISSMTIWTSYVIVLDFKASSCGTQSHFVIKLRHATIEDIYTIFYLWSHAEFAIMNERMMDSYIHHCKFKIDSCRSQIATFFRCLEFFRKTDDNDWRFFVVMFSSILWC